MVAVSHLRFPQLYNAHRVQAGNIALGAGKLTAITQTHSWLQWVEPTRKVKEGKEKNDPRERGNEQVDRER